MTGTEKEALRRAGVTTIQALATLKDFARRHGKADLVPAPGREALVRQLAATWPVGPRLDELVHRARSFRRSVRKDGTQALGYIPGKGTSTLPVSTPDLNPNLVRIYVDAQHDYLDDRVYLLGALVVACKDGTPVGTAGRRPHDGRPARTRRRRSGTCSWTGPVTWCRPSSTWPCPGEPQGEKKSAPIHLVFFDRHEQRLLLEALARNFPPILQATPPLYDFLTQLAAFDSPDRHASSTRRSGTFKNFPMTCQSSSRWPPTSSSTGTRRTRSGSFQGPAVRLPRQAGHRRRDRVVHQAVPVRQFAPAGVRLRRLGPAADAEGRAGATSSPTSGRVTADLLRAFQVRRLEALEHVADRPRRQPAHAEDAVRAARPGRATRTRPTTWPTPCTSSSPSSGSSR